MSSTYDCFSVEIDAFVATVTLKRPPVNAQNRRFREEIISIFDALSDRLDVRAIVLTGDGRTFCHGV
jgi:enoyl-CoA hydratase